MDDAKSSREAASKGPTVLHIRFCSLSNIELQVAFRGTSPDVATIFHTWEYGRFMVEITSGERNFIERIKALNFLGGSFSNRDNVRTTLIQFSRREGQPQHLKRCFSSRTDPFIFISIEPLLDWSNETS